jgi:hypothetical protein
MTDTQLLTALREEFRLLRAVLTEPPSMVLTTAEVVKILKVDARWLTEWHKEGILPSRYGAQKSGYKWSRAEVLTLQTKLLTGEVKLPKR